MKHAFHVAAGIYFTQNTMFTLNYSFLHFSILQSYIFIFQMFCFDVATECPIHRALVELITEMISACIFFSRFGIAGEEGRVHGRGVCFDIHMKANST
jgi:hypothetical protein